MMTNGNCWDEYQICPCCYMELFPVDDPRKKSVVSIRCMNAIKKELQLESTPDQKMLDRIQQKKKSKKKMSYEGVVM